MGAAIFFKATSPQKAPFEEFLRNIPPPQKKKHPTKKKEGSHSTSTIKWYRYHFENSHKGTTRVMGERPNAQFPGSPGCLLQKPYTVFIEQGFDVESTSALKASNNHGRTSGKSTIEWKTRRRRPNRPLRFRSHVRTFVFSNDDFASAKSNLMPQVVNMSVLKTSRRCPLFVIRLLPRQAKVLDAIFVTSRKVSCAQKSKLATPFCTSRRADQKRAFLTMSIAARHAVERSCLSCAWL